MLFNNFKNQRGFTLIELSVVVFCLVIIILGISAMMGNCWYTAAGAEQKLKIQYPEVTKVIDTETNIWRYSIITAEAKEGGVIVRKIYYLDTNILGNYKFYKNK